MKKLRILVILVFLLNLTVVGVFNAHNMKILENNEKTIAELKDRNTELSTEIKALNEDYTKLDKKYQDLLGQPIKAISLSVEDIELLAKVVEAEAGPYSVAPNSQRYVCQVILNRVESGSFPNTVSEVVYQENNGVPQFSVTQDGRLNNEPSKETILNVYKVVEEGTDMPENVVYFFSTSISGGWFDTLNVYATVEGTVFAYGGC